MSQLRVSINFSLREKELQQNRIQFLDSNASPIETGSKEFTPNSNVEEKVEEEIEDDNIIITSEHWEEELMEWEEMLIDEELAQLEEEEEFLVDSDEEEADEEEAGSDGGTDDDSGETSLDEILTKKPEERPAPDEEEDEESILSLGREERIETLSVKVVPPDPAKEFTCRKCYLVKHRSQLADKKRMYCRDCV